MGNIVLSIWQKIRLSFQGRNDKHRDDLLIRRLQELQSLQKELKTKIVNYQPAQFSSPYLHGNDEYAIFSIILFKPLEYSVDNVSMESLWKKREAIERQRIKAIEDKIKEHLKSIEHFVHEGDLRRADMVMNKVAGIITLISNKTIQNKYYSIISKIEELRDKIRLEEIRKEEERKAFEEKERKRREQEAELIRKRELEERLKKDRSERELTERLEREEKKRQQEMEELSRLSSLKSDDAQEIIKYLKDNNVKYFYHFTDFCNISKIKYYGGLYSWAYTSKHKMEIPRYGGDETSRSLDKKHGLQDYVRLSFCSDHPMGYIVKQRTGCRLALLKISINVASIAGVLFSDSNAASNDHLHGEGLNALQTIDIAATQRQYVSRGDPAFAKHQAECMVKTFIPIKYIINIDNPDEI